MHILMVNAQGYDLNPGGVEKGIAMLSDALDVRGHTVSFLNAFPGGRDSGAHVTVLHRTDWRQDPTRRLRNHLGDVVSRPTRDLAKAVARHDPDVVHTHNLPGISTSIWEVCRRLDLPVMHTLHDYHLLCPRVTMMRRDGRTPCRPHPLLCGMRTQRLARWSSAVSHLAGVSSYILDLCGRLFPDAEQHVLRNPLALPDRMKPVPPPGERLASIGYIGALDATKGVANLLEAAPALGRLGCGLHIAGGGKLAPVVAAAAERLPLVRYHGVVAGADKERFFEVCDAGIIPSVRAEPGGPTHTLIEWLCRGRPVLVSRRGGLGEVIDLYPAAIGLEPTVVGVIEGISELADPDRWRLVLAEAHPIDPGGELDDWVDAHEEIYRSMI